ncbi:ribonuclease E/G, partial [Flavobacteriaceae bacterium]|nr:ribonuclease E/G [Flavobacteriaceae bacterium]
AENRKKLFNHLRDEMKDDRAKHKILPPSKFGLIQITRQRVRPEMNIKTKEANPNGTNGSEVEAPIVLIDKINHQLDQIIKKGNKSVTLNTHPFIAAYITKGFPSIRLKWYFQYKKWVKIMPRDAYTYLEYRFKNDNGKTIKL